MKLTRSLAASIFIFFLLIGLHPALAYENFTPPVGLTPDPGFPVWLTPDIDNYLPLRTNQTSGFDWLGSDIDENGCNRHWFIMADDYPDGAIHLVSIVDIPGSPEVHFHRSNLTPTPPEISRLPVDPDNGYDFEAISIYPWGDMVFISQEGTLDEISIYTGRISPGEIIPGESSYCRAGEINFLPGYISNISRFELPEWDTVFGLYFKGNLGIEGIACTEDRLFLGLESPYDFMTRIFGQKSTILGIWKFDPDNPASEEENELIAAIDTADWEPQLGCVIETISGLDAIDSHRLVGIDRDNQRLFALEFSEEYALISGRTFYLDCPGPEPVESDGCDDIDHLPDLIKPSLESVAVVPSSDPSLGDVEEYYIYLACDPWGPGWALNEPDWGCDGYEQRLRSLLPALYRYTIPADTLFPE